MFVGLEVYQNEDGSFAKVFTNGTKVWFGGPPPKTETPEMKAFRIVSIRSDPDGMQTFFFANGTVALYNGTEFVGYLVKPTSYFVTRQVIINDDGSFFEEFSNGTMIRNAPPLDERADELERARYIIREEKNSDGSGKRFFFNGTVIATRNGTFVSYIVKPKSFYYGCVKSFDEVQSMTRVRCWNNTVRKYPTFNPDETDYDRATGLLFLEYIENPFELSNITYHFRNGTVTMSDSEGNWWYIRPPTSYYVGNTT
jgi:hypothetical protein